MCVATALELGMTLLDTADIYGRTFGHGESMLGELFVKAPNLREKTIVATKGGVSSGLGYNSQADYLERACEHSLRRLRVEAIDLYQIHRPDVLTHPENVARVLTRLRASGKIREVGVSNYSESQFSTLQHFLEFPIATTQIQINLLNRSALFDGVLDQCMRLEVAPLASSPLAQGRLAAESTSDASVLNQAISKLARQFNVSSASIGIAYLLALPAGVVPILGTTRPDRLRQAAQAAQIRLSQDHLYELMIAAGAEFP